MSEYQVWKENDASQPKFPENFEVLKKAVLQVTDIVTNRNKYYAVELHKAGNQFRIYTHYGRTDDLDSNPNAGVRESRYVPSIGEAESLYNSIYAQKTSARKGYKELNLASSKIGSRKTMGQSSGVIDEKTIQKMAEKDPKESKKAAVVSKISIPQAVQELVEYLYGEATNALTQTVNATITAKGIETPLGVLTIGQIEKGEAVLQDLAKELGKGKASMDILTRLSGEFYTVIPHRFGRSREAALDAVISTANKVSEKEDTLQLMRDMLNVNSKGNNVLVNPEIEQKYLALNCKIESVDRDIFQKMKDYVENSPFSRRAKIKNIWRIQRPDEVKNFTTSIKNNKMLFHGSKVKNWVGILSRGLLLPKLVVKMGVHRTDAGWLGHGIYFGDAAYTSLNYAGQGRRGTSFMAIANVALGKMKDFSKITYGLERPPEGYDSCHGVRGTGFADDEFVIYSHDQQKLEYICECLY